MIRYWRKKKDVLTKLPKRQRTCRTGIAKFPALERTAIYPRPRKQFNGLSKQLRKAGTFKARFSFVFGAGYLPVRVTCWKLFPFIAKIDRVLICSLDCLCPLRLARVITLVLVLQYSIENRSITQSAKTTFKFGWHDALLFNYANVW